VPASLPALSNDHVHAGSDCPPRLLRTADYIEPVHDAGGIVMLTSPAVPATSGAQMERVRRQQQPLSYGS
jgi:hypothetical protein